MQIYAVMHNISFMKSLKFLNQPETIILFYNKSSIYSFWPNFQLYEKIESIIGQKEKIKKEHHFKIIKFTSHMQMYSYQTFPQFYQMIANGRKPHPKSKFTPSEDEKLKSIVNEVGENSWAIVSKRMGTRNQRQCKERWFNYLSPKVNFQPWTAEEDQQLEKLHEELGAKWVKISQYFPFRTDTNIKNRWMVLQRQKIRKQRKDTNQQNEFQIQESSVSSPETEPTEEKSPSQEVIRITELIELKDEKVESFNLFDEQFDLSLTEVINDQFCLDFF